MNSENDAPQVLLPNDDTLGLGQISFNERVEPKNKPTFWETGKANARLFNDMIRGGNWLIDNAFPSAFEDTTTKEGYNPITSGLVDKVRPEDQLRVIQTDTLREGETMVRRIHEEYNDKDVRERSGWFANLVTTLGAGIISPTTLIPISQTLKYATVGAGALKNALNVSKSLVPAIALQNAVLVGTKETESYRDWVQDTLVESFIGAAIGGALGAFAAKGVQKSTSKVKAVFQSVEDDIGIRHVMNPDGSIQKLEGYHLGGHASAGAAANESLANVNQILDTVNPLENNPYTKKFFSWAHPIMEGLTSRFSVVKEMTDLLNAHNFRIAGGDVNKIRDAAAENFQRLWRSKNSSLMFETDQSWLRYIGAEGLGGGIKGTVGAWQGKFIPKSEFYEMVGKSVRRNADTGVPVVDEAASKWIKELYDPLWDELKKRRPDLTEHEFTNIKRYLNRIYDKPLVQQDTKGFMDDYMSFLGDVNNRVFQWQNKLASLTAQRKTLRKRLKFLKEQTTRSKTNLPHPEQPPLKQLKAERRQVEKDIRRNREYQKKVDAEIAEKIKTGEIDLAMLSEKPNLTPAQMDQVEKLNAPIEKAREAFENALDEYRAFGKRKPAPAEEKLKEEKRKIVSQKRAAVEKAKEAVKQKRKSPEVNAKVNKARQEFNDALTEYRKLKAKRIGKPEKNAKGKDLREEARLKVQEKRKALKESKEQLYETLRSKEFNAEISSAESELSAAEKNFEQLGKRGRTAEEKELREEARKAVQSKREAFRKKKEQLQRILRSERLDEKIWWKRASANGDIKYGLKNPKKGRLRELMDEADIRQRATRSMDTILQQNDDQLVGQMFDAIQATGPSALKERSMMWNDELAEKWLINDIGRLGGVYMNQMVNRIHLDDVFRKFAESGTPEEGKKNVASMLRREFKEQQAPLLQKEQTPEVKKQLAKLDKDFEKAQKFLEKMYKVALGDFGDRSAVSFRLTNSLKEMAVATMLGNLPILELTEFFTPLFKFTFSEYVQDGLMPMLRYWNELRRTNKVDRAAFQDLGVGHNVAHGKWQQVLNGNSPQSLPKTVTERYIKNMANLSNNISMANHITDFQEVMVAFMSQAKTLRVLEKFEKGEALSTADIARFDELRLNPLKYGKQIVEQMRKHGEKFEGGWVANWHLWDKEAFEAQQAFKIAIEKETRSLITKPNNLDMPFGFKDNILASLATQFMSFPFSATLNFTVPILTNPDSQKFIGMLMTMASAAMIDPLRQLAKGEEVELDPEKLATSAFTNSGFFGWQADTLQRFNSALDLPFMRPFQGDRFRKKDPWSLIGGPTAGMMTDIGNVLSAIANGDITRRDADKIFRYIVPFSGSWYLRQPVGAMIDSIGLSETREKRG